MKRQMQSRIMRSKIIKHIEVHAVIVIANQIAPELVHDGNLRVSEFQDVFELGDELVVGVENLHAVVAFVSHNEISGVIEAD